MSKQNWGCLDKMSEVNFSPAETLQWDGSFEHPKHMMDKKTITILCIKMSLMSPMSTGASPA